MNALIFSEILSDLPDEFIESAAEPQIHPIRWQHFSAIAAGIVLLIAAAVYPKLRMQTPPVIDPPAVITETAVTTAPQSPQTNMTQTQTVPTATQPQTADTTAVTQPPTEKTALPKNSAPQETEKAPSTTANAVFSTIPADIPLQESPETSHDTPVTVPQTVPVVTRPSSTVSVPPPIESEPCMEITKKSAESTHESASTTQITQTTETTKFTLQYGRIPVLYDTATEFVTQSESAVKPKCSYRLCDIGTEWFAAQYHDPDFSQKYDIIEITFEGVTEKASIAKVYDWHGYMTFVLDCAKSTDPRKPNLIQHFYIPFLKELQVQPVDCDFKIQWRSVESRVPAELEEHPDWEANQVEKFIIQ